MWVVDRIRDKVKNGKNRVVFQNSEAKKTYLKKVTRALVYGEPCKDLQLFWPLKGLWEAKKTSHLCLALRTTDNKAENPAGP